MSERQSDSMRFKQDLDAHITRSDEQPQPVTFEALKDVIAHGHLLTIRERAEALEQQVRALRDDMQRTHDSSMRSWSTGECISLGAVAEWLETVTALLGKRG